MSREEATQTAKRLLSLSKAVCIQHVVNAVTQVADDRVLLARNGESFKVMLAPVGVNGQYPVTVETNQLDDVAIRSAIEQAARWVGAQRTSYFPLDPPSAPDVPMKPVSFIPVKLAHDTTIAAMTDGRRSAVTQMLGAMRAQHVTGAATVALSARSVIYMYPDGLTAFGESTDAEVIVNARTQGTNGVGWSAATARDWSRIDPEHVAAQAIDLAQRAANPVVVEPGRRTVILEPTAVAQFLRHMDEAFQAQNVEYGTSPFSKGVGHGTRLGQRLFDPRVTITTDPADAEGGYFPFFDTLWYGDGLPSPAMTLVKDGVLANLSYDVAFGLKQGKTYSVPPSSYRMSGGPATVAEMIAGCTDGIYVTRFGNTDLVEPSTGLVTGTTQGGCFLVRNGKIDKPIKSLRFLDSPIFCLNRLQMIGAPVRAAMGTTPPPAALGFEAGEQWPFPPVIVPPLMIGDFNFVALSDAV